MNKNNKSGLDKLRSQMDLEYLTEETRRVANELYQKRGGGHGGDLQDWLEAERIVRARFQRMHGSTGVHVFDRSLLKTKEWLKDVENELGITDPNDAYSALRSVLHALRDRLPVKEASEFASQLPMFLAGVYYSGWDPSGKPVKMRTMDDFLDHINRDLPRKMGAETAARAVFRVIDKHISPGETEKIKRNMPDTILKLWHEKLAVAA